MNIQKKKYFWGGGPGGLGVGFGGQGGCDRRIEVFGKIHKNKLGGGGGSGGGVGSVGRGGGVRIGGVRVDVFVKIHKKIGGSGGEGSGWGGQGGCDRRIEVFGKIHKNGGGGLVRLGVGSGVGAVGSGGEGGAGWGVRVDVNEELKFL